MGSLKYQPISIGQMLRHNLIHVRDMALVEFIAYFAFGVGLFALAMHLDRAGAFRFLIRRPQIPRDQVHREVKNSALSVILYNVVQIAARAVVLIFGYIVTLDRPLPAWQIALSFPLVLVVHDAYFYWTHRMMHARAFFRFFHWEHHKSSAPTVFTAYSFAIPEAVVQGLFGVFYVALFPCTMATLIFFQFVEIGHNLIIHSGIDFYPRTLVTDRRWGWLAGPAHHDIHHRTSHGNFGLYTRAWDRLMRTENPDFARLFNYVHSPANDGEAYAQLAAARPAPATQAARAPAPETAAAA